MTRTPCCDAPFDLASPPLGYECRECGHRYDLAAKPGADEPSFPDEEDAEPDEEPADEPAEDGICGEPTADGSPCQNDAAACPHH